MSYTYLLAGENLELARCELKGFLNSQELSEEISGSKRLVETRNEPSQLKRLALTHEVGEKLSEFEISNLEGFEPEFKPKRSFSVRAELLSGDIEDKESIEKTLGEKFSDECNSVDLESPETELKAYIDEKKIIVSEIVEDINRGLFENRVNQERPFSSPISLDPILARVLVNLSGIKPGEHVLDPFCGTGGILIEAGLCGIGVNGFDLQEKMVNGCRENLEEYGIISHDINQLDISNANNRDLGDFGAIVTDLPYGKSSKKTDEAVEHFLELLEGFEGICVFMYNEDELGSYEADFSVYVHKNLTRYIYVVD
jgi:tRNA (guanine10-N2)-dimethyltransferase